MVRRTAQPGRIGQCKGRPHFPEGSCHCERKAIFRHSLDFLFRPQAAQSKCDDMLVSTHWLLRPNPTRLIADNLSKAGWSWGCVSAVDSGGRTISIADAHRDDGKRFVVRADEKLTAFWNLNRRFAPSLHKIKSGHLVDQRLAE